MLAASDQEPHRHRATLLLPFSDLASSALKNGPRAIPVGQCRGLSDELACARWPLFLEWHFERRIRCEDLQAARWHWRLVTKMHCDWRLDGRMEGA